MSTDMDVVVSVVKKVAQLSLNNHASLQSQQIDVSSLNESLLTQLNEALGVKVAVFSHPGMSLEANTNFDLLSEGYEIKSEYANGFSLAWTSTVGVGAMLQFQFYGGYGWQTLGPGIYMYDTTGGNTSPEGYVYRPNNADGIGTMNTDYFEGGPHTHLVTFKPVGDGRSKAKFYRDGELMGETGEDLVFNPVVGNISKMMYFRANTEYEITSFKFWEEALESWDDMQ